MNEIICIQVGQCGNQLGTAFWDAIRKEHQIDENGEFQHSKGGTYAQDDAVLAKIEVFFKETGEFRFTPRVVLVDLEPGTLDVIKASPTASLFRPDNFVFGAAGAGNNFAKGYYTEGAELVDEIMDVVRRETEACDSPQGFILFHSIGGGTGSGLGTLLLSKIRDAYPDRMIATFSVFPSPKISDVVVEPYNATLAIHKLSEYSDMTFVIDNEALFNISHNVLQQKEPKYADLNWFITQAMVDVTAPLRFEGMGNGNLRKMACNLLPFPHLHFLLLARAPLFAPGQGNKIKLTVQELAEQVWSSRNFFSNITSDDGKYLSVYYGFRGNTTRREVDEESAKVQQKMSDDFVTWIPNSIKSDIIDTPPENTLISAVVIANTTAMKGIFQRISAQFAKLYKSKAFLPWYKGEGMDEMEFQEADKNMRDLITEYQDKQDAVVDLDDDEEDAEEDAVVNVEEEEEEDY
ncbi:MAG: hypothetical protein GKR94_31530 [Gammaproteobacteria bacterium]|nr:hypothetical protein [Gammaproteobacteria bacterium]